MNKGLCFPLVNIAILTLILSLCGCAQKRQQEPDFLQDLVCQAVELDVEFLIPLQITYTDGRFFIPDFHGDRMIHEIKREPFEWVHDFGARGKGPAEFIGPLLTWEFNSQLFVFDRRVFRLGVFDIMTPNNSSAYNYSELFYVESTVNQLISLNNDTYLAAGYFEDGRYAVLDSLGRAKSFFGPYPAFMAGENRIPDDAKAMFHQVQFTANHGEEKIAALSSHVMDIIDISEHVPEIISRIKLGDYEYDHQSGTTLRTTLKDGFAFGVRSVTSCSKYIYVLNNPRIKGDVANEEQANIEILIFDWNGKPAGKHHVFCDVILIQAVDSTTLYGITKNQEFVVLGF